MKVVFVRKTTPQGHKLHLLNFIHVGYKTICTVTYQLASSINWDGRLYEWVWKKCLPSTASYLWLGHLYTILGKIWTLWYAASGLWVITVFQLITLELQICFQFSFSQSPGSLCSEKIWCTWIVDWTFINDKIFTIFTLSSYHWSWDNRGEHMQYQKTTCIETLRNNKLIFFELRPVRMCHVFLSCFIRGWVNIDRMLGLGSHELVPDDAALFSNLGTCE